MADSVLGSTLYKNLTDKLYDKRKAAALDLEKHVRDLHAQNQVAQIERIIDVLGELSLSNNSNNRKGGLLGMAGAAIALGNNAKQYTARMIDPVLICLDDPDLQIRYYACESAYNIVKMCKDSCLQIFERLFNNLSKLASDSELKVRSASELINRQLKIIVCGRDDFDVSQAMTLICQGIYTEVSSSRNFFLEWLDTLLTTPIFKSLPYLAPVLDGLFKILAESCDSVRTTSEKVMMQFLQGMHKEPEALSEGDLHEVVNVVCIHAHVQEATQCRKAAILWLNELAKLYKARLIPMLSIILKAVLPALESTDLNAKSVNDALRKIISPDARIDMDDIVKVLLEHLSYPLQELRLASLMWIRLLHNQQPNQLFAHMAVIFPLLLATLSDSSDEVVLLDLHLISDLCSHKDREAVVGLGFEKDEDLAAFSPFLVLFAKSLLSMFREDTKLLNDRGALIIRQLCLLIEPADIYSCLATLLEKEDCAVFKQSVVSVLHWVLMTSTELFLLRDRLKRMEDGKTAELMYTIYRCWTCRPICIIGLCLLTKQYKHAAELVNYLGEVDVTVDFLVEVDKLVNLVESPVLAFTRLDLLRSCYRDDLCYVFTAITMLLPQTEPFDLLRKRLQIMQEFKVSRQEAQIAPNKFLDLSPMTEVFVSALKKMQKELRDRHREVLRKAVEAIALG